MADMRQRGWGRIVNVTSVGVHTGGFSATSAVYEATKAALGSLTKTLARHGAAHGILVNAVAPGGIRTRMMVDETPPRLLAAFERDVPLGRLATPAEVAEVVAFLTGEEAAYVTGATFDVNGGVVIV
jgi:NAD(P)-dependent dehydrogenase (short-subunit alcohol dehydrogenase family)